MSKKVCTLPKNSRETIWFSLGEYKGHRFVDMRVFCTEDGQAPVPTKKGLTVPPHLWPELRQALTRVEAAPVAAGWQDREDLAQEQAGCYGG